jgi:hypothetical protein
MYGYVAATYSLYCCWCCRSSCCFLLQVVKGGKIMGFRCVAVVGDGKGRVGVGCQAGREVSTAVKRALVDAKKVSASCCCCGC